MRMRRIQRRITGAVFAVGLALPALVRAHEASHGGGGFAAGFGHPFGGLDHVLAMLAVGMWGAELKGRAVWLLPVAFPVVMAAGGVWGILGLPLPAVEAGIALSVVVLGGAIAANYRPKLLVAAALVGTFALFHGFAHGTELPGQAGPAPYSVGFVLATGLIHLAGVGIGLVTELPAGLALLRTGGAAIAAAGLVIAGNLFVG